MDVVQFVFFAVCALTCFFVTRRAVRQRRNLEAKLEEERVFMAAVLDNINDGITVCDADGILALFNRAACDMHGLPQQAIGSDNWAEQYDLYLPDGKTPMQEHEVPLVRAYRGEVIRDCEMVIAPAGRTPLTVQASGRAMIGPDGRKLGAIVSMHDVTEKRRAIDEGRQVRKIIESSPNIVFKWRADADWTVEYVSENVCQLGFDTEDFTDGSIAFPSLIHSEDLPRVEAEIERHVDSDKNHFVVSFRIVDDVGRHRWVETWLVIIRDDAGTVTHYHGILVDVTDREVISEMLRDSEERKELALHGADLGMWDWDVPSGRGIYDERWCAMLGLTIDEVNNHITSWSDLIHPDDAAAVQEVLQAHLDGKTPIYESEHRLLHGNGHWVWVLSRGCVTSRDEDGAALRMTGTHLDVTARKIADAEAHALEAQMQQAQKLESLGMLAGGIAHDFNNILMAILGNAELARLETPEDTPVVEHIDEIESAAGRAADLCNQMLAYSGKGRFQMGNIDLTAEIPAISRMLSVGISKNVDLRFDLDEDAPAICADVSQVRQVVMNLITNAAEAIGDQAGTIDVRTHVIDPSRCQAVSGCGKPCKGAHGPCLRLEVKDSGCGMDELTQERLFEPFYSTKDDGRGLGMAAVIGIVRSHGGTVEVDSELGAGSTISFCLPCERSTAPAGPDLPDADPVMVSNGNLVLLVDDEDAVLKLGSRLLESLGWNVITAVDGLDALAVVESHGQDLSCVILDVTMPRMGGIEARERILKLQPELPVILCSGYHGSEILGRTNEDVPFIQKPYRRRELGRTLEKAASVLA